MYTSIDLSSIPFFSANGRKLSVLPRSIETSIISSHHFTNHSTGIPAPKRLRHVSRLPSTLTQPLHQPMAQAQTRNPFSILCTTRGLLLSTLVFLIYQTRVLLSRKA